MGYTEKDILAMCQEEINNIQTFYQAKCVNYRGYCSDTGKPYSEVVAEYVYKNIDRFYKGIPVITRKASYRTKGHDGSYDVSSNRLEEIIAMKLYNQCKVRSLDYIGNIIDYQTPLKSKLKDQAGKIDFLAYDGKCLRLLELKKLESKETMLRCVLEGFTYLKMVNIKKLLSDFHLPPNTSVKACPLVFRDSVQYKEIQQERPHLKLLMTELDSKPYYLRLVDGLYTVLEGIENALV